jgi:hypothetical protein
VPAPLNRLFLLNVTLFHMLGFVVNEVVKGSLDIFFDCGGVWKVGLWGTAGDTEIK